MTTSFFLGCWTIRPAPNSGMPLWQDRLFNTLSRQAANATDFFAIRTDRVVELGAQVTVRFARWRGIRKTAQNLRKTQGV